MIPRVLEQDIRRRFEPRVYEPGRRYFAEGRVLATRRSDHVLRARCEGSSDSPYEISITLDEHAHGWVASCTCPVGEGGGCKHTAAVLLAYAERPDDFVEVESLSSALARRSKEELIELLERVCKVHTDVESMIVSRQAPIDLLKPEHVIERARSLLEDAIAHHTPGRVLAPALQKLLVLADQIAASGDLDSGARAFDSVSSEVIARYDAFDDEGGELAEIVRQCADGMARCLEGRGEIAARGSLLRALFVVFEFAAARGDATTAIDRLARTASGVERMAVAEWARSSLRGLGPITRRAYGELILRLLVNVVDDNTLLERLREADHHAAMARLLLNRERGADAAHEAAHLSDDEIATLASAFDQRGQGELLDGVIASRITRTRSIMLLTFWSERLLSKADNAGALSVSEMLFNLDPSLARYKLIKGQAQQLGTWAEVQPRLEKTLQSRRYERHLVDVLLFENRLDEAIEKALKRPIDHGFGHGRFEPDELSIPVADAVEQSHPQACVDLLKRHASWLVEQRGRNSYAEAAQLLVRALAVASRIQNEQDVRRFATKLREEHSSLRALNEELAEVGLLGSTYTRTNSAKKPYVSFRFCAGCNRPVQCECIEASNMVDAFSFL